MTLTLDLLSIRICGTNGYAFLMMIGIFLIMSAIILVLLNIANWIIGICIQHFYSRDTINSDVKKYGTFLGSFTNMTKEEVEAYCSEETKRTGKLHDWYYFGGRPMVYYLDKKPTVFDRIIKRIK